MPTINQVKAMRWRVTHDLTGGFAAKSFDIAYTKVGSDNVWDSGQYDSIALYRGEASPDLVRIKADFDGDERDIILGVVDRSGREQTDEGVAGSLGGRDKAALMLDRYPSAAFTLEGITVVNNLPVAGMTYREAVEEVATFAGLTVSWNVGTDDYDLGRSIAVTTDQTFGEIIQQLMEPWNFGERHNHDAWVSDDGLTLFVVRRNLLGDVAVRFERMVVNRYEKRVLPTVNDVRVEGVTYQTIVANSVFTICNPAIPEVTTTDYDVQGGNIEESYIETQKVFRDSNCKEFKKEITTAYKDGLRTTMQTWETEFYSAPLQPHNGLPKRTTFEKRETNTRGTRKVDPRDGTAEVDASYNLQSALVENTISEFVYYTDDGALKQKDEDHRIYAKPNIVGVPKIVQGYIESNGTYTRERIVRGIGYVTRHTITENSDVRSDGRKQTSTHRSIHEQVPFKIGTATQSAVNQGFSQVPVTISAGPTTSKRKEKSDMLGDETSAGTIRTRLVSEHAATIVEASVSMTPDHRIKPGNTLVIVGAPAWFDLTSLYVLASEIDASDRGASQTLRCLGYID